MINKGPACQVLFDAGMKPSVGPRNSRVCFPFLTHVFVRDAEGVTHLDPKGDGRHFISNGKDQAVKVPCTRAAVAQLHPGFADDQRSSQRCLGRHREPPKYIQQAGRCTPHGKDFLFRKCQRSWPALFCFDRHSTASKRTLESKSLIANHASRLCAAMGYAEVPLLG